MKDIHRVYYIMCRLGYSKPIHYIFRKGAVPYIHNVSRHKCHVSHVAQNYKQKEMLRSKTRVSLGDLWYDDYRHTDRCWKTNKRRHQWQKHLK